jgi:hypothetical protein
MHNLPSHLRPHPIPTKMASIVARPFKLALVQLAGLGKDKTANLALARAGVKKAVQEGKADVVVLPVRSFPRASSHC